MLKMNCLELRYNKDGESKLIKITRGTENKEQVTNQSDEISDWDLLFDFLTTGNLPQDVKVEGINNKEELLDFLVSELSKSPKKLQTYMLFDKRGGLKSREDVINKIIGNKSIQNVLYETYLDDMFTNNCLYVSGWGAKTWYGFTETRPLMITGRPMLDQNPTENTLFTSYYELRNGSEFVSNIINKLFEKHADYKSDDIFDKLTWLANNKLKVLVDALYIPQYKLTDRQTIRKDLISDITPYVGYGIKYKSELYVITKKGNNNTIIGVNIDTNEKIEIPISSIFNVYEPFLIRSKRNNYYLFNKSWYLKQKDGYTKIIDPTKTSTLFNHFFGIIEGDFESVNVYNSKKPVTLSTILPNSELTVSESLPIGSIVRTSSGRYEKQIDGKFVKDGEILDDSAIIYKIDYKIDPELGIDFTKYISTEKHNYGTLTEDGQELLSTTFHKHKFHEAITNVSLIPGVSGTELHIKGISPKNGKSFELVYHNGASKVINLYIEGKDVTNVNDPNYSNAIDTYIPFEILNLIYKGKFKEMDNIPTKLKEDGIIVESTQLSDFFEIEYNVFSSGRSTAYNKKQITKIFYGNTSYNNINLIKSLFPIYEPEYALNQQDALIILANLYGFDPTDEELWDNVKFSYDSDHVKVRQIGENVILDIGLKGKITQTIKNIQNLDRAVMYFDHLRNGDLNLDGMSVLDFWYVLEAFKPGTTEVKVRNKKITLTQAQIESAMMIIDDTDEVTYRNLTEWEDTVKENRKDTLKTIHNENDAEWDAFINELINKGLYIMSCKL